MLDCCLERMVGILLHFPILVIFPPHIVITFCVRYKMSLSGSFPDMVDASHKFTAQTVRDAVSAFPFR